MNYLTKQEVLTRLNIPFQRLCYLKQRGKLPRCIRDGKYSLYSEEDIIAIEDDMERKSKLFTIAEACELMQMSIYNFYKHYNNNGFFETLQKIDEKIYIQRDEVLTLIKENEEYNNMVDFVNSKQAADSLNYHSETILRLIGRGLLPNARKTRFYSSFWKIPLSDIKNYKEFLEFTNKDYLQLEKVSLVLNCSSLEVVSLINEGFFPNAFQLALNNEWRIPKENLKSFKDTRLREKVRTEIRKEVSKEVRKEIRKEVSNRQEKIELDRNLDKYFNVCQVSALFKVSKAMVTARIREGVFEDVVKIGIRYYIPKDEISLKLLTKKVKQKAFQLPSSTNSLKDKIDYILSKIENPHRIQETIIFFRKYYDLKYHNTGRKNKDSYSSFLSRCFINISDVLTKDLFLYNDVELLELLSNKRITITDKKFVIGFINYISAVKNDICVYKNKYSFTSKVRNITDKEIYSKEEFRELYEYVRNIDRHKKRALSDSVYAETWFYVIMHFINAWRSSDILDFPKVELSFINDLYLQQISEQSLTLADSQIIINSVAETWERFVIGKTGGLNRFLVNLDMVQSVATSLIILEKHHRENSVNKLLPCLSKRSVRAEKLKLFFIGNQSLPVFSSLKTNRSIITYLFHSVSQGSKNGDVAHLLAQKLRGHIDSDVISQYVMNTNADDYIDDISYNLFRRGHFGWLYNYLVDIVVNSKNKGLSLEEKTLLIEQYQKYYSPQDVESLSKFFLMQQNKNHSIALEIAMMPEDDLAEKLNKIYRGYMPSKEENGQCLFSKQCRNPRGDCLICPFLIPKIYLLTSLKNEIEAKINRIRRVNEHEISERIRTTSILFKLLGLLNQSVIFFGKEYTNSFVELNELQNDLISIENKIALPERR